MGILVFKNILFMILFFDYKNYYKRIGRYVMFKDFEKQSPTIDVKTFVAEGCHIIGKVTMLEYSSVWFNSVVRGDVNSITIGRYSNVQDNSTVHVGDNHPTIIGDFVTIGHRAIIHGCTIEDHVLIGMGATVLNGAKIGRGSIIAAGAVVKENFEVPEFSLVAGVPAKIIKQLPEDISKIHSQAVKYKTLWSERYGTTPDIDGERYNGEEIV